MVLYPNKLPESERVCSGICTIQREVVTVSLLDESGSPVKTWEAVNAWPKKLTVEDFKPDGNTTSIETLVIAHEGVNVK